MEEVIIPIVIVPILFIGLPWLVFHYITRWKTAATLTNDDEKLMEELYDLARRLDDRMCSIERIMTAENPNWRAIACDPADPGFEGQIGERTVSNQPARRIGQ